jgi:hypothetical protein
MYHAGHGSFLAGGGIQVLFWKVKVILKVLKVFLGRQQYT